MPSLAKQIYRQLNDLFPDFQHFEPYARMDLSSKGLPGINVVVLDAVTNRISLVVCRYQSERGCVVANPSFEIVAHLKRQTANVVTYMDDHYFHKAVREPAEVGSMSRAKANRFLRDFLNDVKAQQQSLE